MEFVKNQEKYWEFIRRIRNDKRVKAGLIDGQPAGYVGVIDRDIRVATHPDFQGKGVGKFMINALMTLYPDSLAKVKIENTASLRLFETCGFQKRYYILDKNAS